jgi:hypothetical protein
VTFDPGVVGQTPRPGLRLEQRMKSMNLSGTKVLATMSSTRWPDLQARYLAGLASGDSIVRATAHHQLAVLQDTPTFTERRCYDEHLEPPTTLRVLVEQVVGPLHERPSGDLEGACPWHASSSGRSLVVFADGARWWCRSCRRGGDAAKWLALIEGITVAEAGRRLGLPSVRRPRIRRRPTLRIEVAAWPSSLS